MNSIQSVLLRVCSAIRFLVGMIPNEVIRFSWQQHLKTYNINIQKNNRTKSCWCNFFPGQFGFIYLLVELLDTILTSPIMWPPYSLVFLRSPLKFNDRILRKNYHGPLCLSLPLSNRFSKPESRCSLVNTVCECPVCAFFFQSCHSCLCCFVVNFTLLSKKSMYMQSKSFKCC